MRVSLFVTCLVDVFYPEVGKSVVEILEENGVDVDFPMSQICCGQPAFNSGYQKQSRETAKQLIRSFAKSEYVVAPSGSCVSMIKHYYPKLFEDDPSWRREAEALAKKTFELTDFLVNVLKLTDLDTALQDSATYHHSCHMSRGIEVKEEPLQLLSLVEDLKLKELPYCQDCCGFGGTFAVKMNEISTAMADEKIKQIESTGANLVVGADMGCLMHLDGRMRRTGKSMRVMHIAEVLAKGGKS